MCAVMRPPSRGQSVPTSNPSLQQSGPTLEGGLLREWELAITSAATKAANDFCGDEAVAADFAQQARLGMLQAARTRPTASAAYLRGVVNCAIKNARRRERRGFSLWSPQASEMDEAVVERAAEDVQETDNKVTAIVSAWVATLPERLRQVYALLYQSELSQRDAAAEMKLSQPRVAQLHRDLLNRARRELAHLAA